MGKRLLLLLALAAAWMTTGAAELPQAVKLNKDGSLRIGSANLLVQVYSDKWATGSWEVDGGKIGRSGGEASGVIKLSGKEIKVTESIQPLNSNSFRYTVNAAFPEPMKIAVFCATLQLPTGVGPFNVTVDGKKLDLPEKFNDKPIKGVNAAKSLEAVLTGGVTIRVEGNFRLAVQDHRKFKNERMGLRLYGTPGSGTIDKSLIDLTVTVNSVKSTPVDISQAVNFGFADEQANDGKGGWSDQGPTNDLRSFTKRKVEVESVRFNIIDPAKNNGKAAIVMGRTVDKSPVKVELPANTRARGIALLHASAWTPAGKKPLGTINVTYADGSVEKIPVSLQDDSGNWWSPMPRSNAAVAWKHENQSASIGLYAAPFELKRDDPRSVEFELNTAPEHADAMWMIAGVTLLDRPMRFTFYSNDVQIVAGKKWQQLEFSKEIVTGSPLDFSRYVEAPAGKYGSIIARPDGTLAFENAPEKRVRLFGANLCFSASYLEKEEADRLAKTFRMLGYNAVRIHHHDTEILDSNAEDSLTFDPAKVDKLDYLVYAMSREGLYVTTDLYTNRVFKPGDNIPECKTYKERQMKALLPVSQAAMDNWKAFSRKLLEHRNPYTGKRWKEDPAIYSYNLVNEETLSSNWRSVQMSDVYLERYDKWVKQRGYEKSDRRFRQFLNELQDKVLAEQLRYLRDELQVKPLLTSLNYQHQTNLVQLRHRFDLVDNHNYHDHPTFPQEKWQMPKAYSQRCATQQKASLPRNMMPTRIFDKPFMVTEFNYVNPNIYRAEGGPLIGGYAALQDWDALYRFAWSHSRNSVINLGAPGGFDAANDPLAQLSDRISVLLFRRGDVEPAKEKYAYVVPANLFDTDEPLSFPREFSELGLIAQIGSVYANNPVPAGVIRLNFADSTNPAALVNKTVAKLWEKCLKEGVAESATGQLLLNSEAKTFVVRTPRAETLTLPGGDLAGNWMALRNASAFQTVAALSLDDLPLDESKSILLLQLTNIVNTDAVFGNPEFTLHRKGGRLPILAERGTATVEIQSATPFKVTALKTDGSPAGEIKGKVENGKFVFQADTASFPCGVMAMHLTR